MSLLTGDHPQSYTQKHLHLFSKPRSRTPTPQLHSLIGVLSPELFDAFPRRPGVTAWEAVGTGFDGGFVPLGEGGLGVGLKEGGLSGEERAWREGREGGWKREGLGKEEDVDAAGTIVSEVERFMERER